MLRTLCVSVLVLIAVPAAGKAPVSSGPQPFEARLAATWDHLLLSLTPEGSTFEGDGPALGLGQVQQSGDLYLEFDGSTIVPGHGSVTITTVLGEEITFDYDGLLNILTGEGVALFHFTGGTGRFRHAKGGGALSAVIDLSGGFEAPPMSVILVGEIDY